MFFSSGLLKKTTAMERARISPDRVIILNISAPEKTIVAGRTLDNIMESSASRTPKPPGAPGVMKPPNHAKIWATTIIGKLLVFKSVSRIKEKMQNRITQLINKNTEYNRHITNK